jgi:hypothetical protein
MRVKTEWVLDHDEKTGKTAPRKVGLAPVMRDGIEYEFDVLGDMDHENTLDITKSRCPKLTGASFPKPGKELADGLKEWLSAVPLQPLPAPTAAPENPPAVAEPPKTVPENGAGSQNNGGDYPPRCRVPEELQSIWRRMCSPRGVAREFAELQAAIEQLAGSAGNSEYHRILRQHGAQGPKDFSSAQPARLCSKDLFALVTDLRAAARENQAPAPASDAGQDAAATEVR